MGDILVSGFALLCLAFAMWAFREGIRGVRRRKFTERPLRCTFHGRLAVVVSVFVIILSLAVMALDLILVSAITL